MDVKGVDPLQHSSITDLGIIVYIAKYNDINAVSMVDI